MWNVTGSQLKDKTFSHVPEEKTTNVPIPYNAPQAGSYPCMLFWNFSPKFPGFYFFFQFYCSLLIPNYAPANPHRGISITNCIMASTMYHTFLSVLLLQCSFARKRGMTPFVLCFFHFCITSHPPAVHSLSHTLSRQRVSFYRL